jgi:N-glycosylase/DNA lyase
MKRKNFPHRKQQRREDAIKRQEAYVERLRKDKPTKWKETVEHALETLARMRGLDLTMLS